MSTCCGTDDGDASCANQMPPCATYTNGIIGHKPLHWLEYLSPSQLADAEFIWLFDSDLAVDGFDLRRALDIMGRARASIAQPCIWAKTDMRTSSYKFLRCADPISSALCEAQHVRTLEVMSPIFSRRAWTHVYEHLLNLLPRAYLAVAYHGMDSTWCRMVQLQLGSPAPCVLLNVTMEHLDTHSMGAWHRAPESQLLHDWQRGHFASLFSNSNETAASQQRELKSCVGGTARRPATMRLEGGMNGSRLALGATRGSGATPTAVPYLPERLRSDTTDVIPVADQKSTWQYPAPGGIRTRNPDILTCPPFLNVLVSGPDGSRIPALRLAEYRSALLATLSFPTLRQLHLLWEAAADVAWARNLPPALRTKVVHGGSHIGRLTFILAVQYINAHLVDEVVLLTNTDIAVTGGFGCGSLSQHVLPYNTVLIPQRVEGDCHYGAEVEPPHTCECRTVRAAVSEPDRALSVPNCAMTACQGQGSC